MTAPTLTEFLLARYDEDEAHANGWCEDYVPCGQHEHPGHRSEVRTRAECEAKRHIVEDMRDHLDEVGGWGSLCERQLRHLAAVHADHPDYRPEWKP